MKLTKYTHSCVRVEHGGGVLVIDPGIWSEPGALRGADAVLVTHEHADHVDTLRLAGLGAPVYAPAGADLPGVRHTPVTIGDEFEAAGLPIRVIGGPHALIHGGLPDCPHVGYLVDGSLYHPGDALHIPAERVRALLVPLQASWLKLAEAIAFAQQIDPELAFGIHDAQLNERGLSSANGWLSETCRAYRYLGSGGSYDKLPG
jgi:L-ascorbate metabolism protein UlaG (beta-lactamase superfamily)